MSSATTKAKATAAGADQGAVMNISHDDLIDAAMSIADGNIDANSFAESSDNKASEMSQYDPLPLDLTKFTSDGMYESDGESGSNMNSKARWGKLLPSSSRSTNGPDAKKAHGTTIKKEPISTGGMLSAQGRSAVGQKRNKARRKSSSYRGVSFNIKSQKWKAVITVNKKQSFLGYFENEEEAARAYDEASRASRGPMARLNFGDYGCAEETKDDFDQHNYGVMTVAPPPPPPLPGMMGMTQMGNAQMGTSFGQIASNPQMSFTFAPAPSHVPIMSSIPMNHGDFSQMTFMGSSPPMSPMSPSHGQDMAVMFNLGHQGLLRHQSEIEHEKDMMAQLAAQGNSSSNSRMRPRLELDIPSTDGMRMGSSSGSPRKRLKSEEETKMADMSSLNSSTNQQIKALQQRRPSASVGSWSKTSQYRGVSRNRKNGKFKSVLTHKGKQIFLGYFEDEISAAKAYDAACIKHRGRTTTLNFPATFAPERPLPAKSQTSKYRGVSWCKNNNKWKSVITVSGSQRFLGYFETETAAAEAYDKVAVDMRGISTPLNFPNSASKFGIVTPNECLTPTTADLVEKSARLRINSVDSQPPRPMFGGAKADDAKTGAKMDTDARPSTLKAKAKREVEEDDEDDEDDDEEYDEDDEDEGSDFDVEEGEEEGAEDKRMTEVPEAEKATDAKPTSACV